MKKLTFLALIAALLLSLLCATSCNATPAKEPLQSTPQTTPTEEHLQTPSIEMSPENANAIKMYEAAIKGEICVVDERLGEIELSACQFPSSNKRLDEYNLLKKATLDIDGDRISEYVIQSPDQEYILLRYYNAKVYSYCFGSCDYYRFNTDGTFYWCNSPRAVPMECGLSKILFEEEALSIKSLYTLKVFGNPTKYEYFTEGTLVTEAEYSAYRNQNRSKKAVELSYFDLSCSYPITSEQAWELANAYWDHQNGRNDAGAGTIWIAQIVLTDTPSADANYYRVAFQEESYSGGALEGYECMPPHTTNTYDEILVNAFTGEITTPAQEAGSKAISVEQAIEIVKDRFFDEDIHNEEDGYRFEHAVNEASPDHVYVIVIQNTRLNYHVTEWVDKYTGEIIFPYYMWGK